MVSLPPEMDEQTRRDLLDRERALGLELRESGTIVRIWRIPGRLANVGVWRCADATELHSAVSSLPLFPWMTVGVTALAVHPLEEATPPS